MTLRRLPLGEAGPGPFSTRRRRLIRENLRGALTGFPRGEYNKSERSSGPRSTMDWEGGFRDGDLLRRPRRGLVFPSASPIHGGAG